MKRMTLLILFVLVLLALAGLIIRINIKEVVVKSQENLAFQYISDIKNTTQDLKFLSQNGITLENTSKYAKVTPSQAVKIASQVIP
jgi:cell division protein FtsI/penicillin-binding protein 2